jgi:hypothetical protein
MYERVRREQEVAEVKIWQPIIAAWSEMNDDDEDVMMMNDIVPIGFSEAELAAGQPHRRAMCWVWRKT